MDVVSRRMKHRASTRQMMNGRKNQSMKKAKTIGFICRDYSSVNENEEIIHQDMKTNEAD
jgi:hypothetical protein